LPGRLRASGRRLAGVGLGPGGRSAWVAGLLPRAAAQVWDVACAAAPLPRSSMRSSPWSRWFPVLPPRKPTAIKGGPASWSVRCLRTTKHGQARRGSWSWLRASELGGPLGSQPPGRRAGLVRDSGSGTHPPQAAHLPRAWAGGGRSAGNQKEKPWRPKRWGGRAPDRPRSGGCDGGDHGDGEPPL